MTDTLIAKFRTFILSKVLGVQPGEHVAVAWSFAYFFCVLSSYYILRPIRESMAVGSGPDTIPYLFVGTFTVMMIASPVFAWVASRYARRTFLPWVYLFFISNILIFWMLFSNVADDSQDHVWLGRAFFVWLSVFNLFVVSVFWSFMADVYTREQGRRLFGLITSGGSIGALLGGAATSYLVKDIGTQNLFPIAAVVLSVAVICIRRLRHWVANEQSVEHATLTASEPLGGSAFSGISHILGSRYFMSIGASSVIASLLGTALYMFAAQLVEAEIPDTDSRTQFFSNMNVAQNFFALVFQMFIVRHVVKVGLNVSLILMPVVSIAGFIALAVSPVLGVVAFLTVLRRALGFGFSKPSTDMLYSVVTPEEKYKTKNFIDTAIYRGGDLVGTFTVKGLMALGFGMVGISVMMLPFAVAWTFLSNWLGRDYRRQARELARSGIV